MKWFPGPALNGRGKVAIPVEYLWWIVCSQKHCLLIPQKLWFISGMPVGSSVCCIIIIYIKVTVPYCYSSHEVPVILLPMQWSCWGILISSQMSVHPSWMLCPLRGSLPISELYVAQIQPMRGRYIVCHFQVKMSRVKVTWVVQFLLLGGVVVVDPNRSLIYKF